MAGVVQVDDRQIARRYQRGYTVATIAEEMGCDDATIWRSLRRTGTPLRGRTDHRPSYGDILTEDYLRHCQNEEMTQVDIAEAVGCSPSTVAQWLAHYGMLGMSTRAEERRLRQWYESGLTIQQIAGRLGCGRQRARRALLDAGIHLRAPGRRKRTPA